MSGILGFYRLDGSPAQASVLEAMLTSLRHRGPDGSSTWISGSVGLGHLMLRTTPESLVEGFPLRESARGFVLTADIRLDNRADLSKELGLTAKEPGDGAIVLAAYARWGERCVEHLLGDFAFALWDPKRRLLFCARDPFGTKSFYYHHETARLFAFGSEERAVLSCNGVSSSPDRRRIADYLVDLCDHESTFFSAIRCLPAAHSMTVHPEGIVLRRYWDLDPTKGLEGLTDEEYADGFRDRFVEAVRCRLRSDHPVGVLLSGGLDSSSITCIASRLLAEQGRGPLHTFTSRFESFSDSNETAFVEAVLQRGGLQPHVVLSHEIPPLQYLRELVDCLGGPCDNPHASAGWSLRQTIGEQAVRVVLDGGSGDIVVSYDLLYLTELARTPRRWPELFREARAVSRTMWGGRRSALRILLARGVVPFLPGGLQTLLFRARGENPRSTRRIGLVHPSLAREVGLRERLQELRQAHRSIRDCRMDHYLSLGHPTVARSSETTDKLNSRHGFEGRSPFLDRRLAEYCLALPREQKFSGGLTRPVVRRALGEVLPVEVRSRPGKGDYNRDFAQNLHSLEKDRLSRFMREGVALIDDCIDVDFLRDCHARFLEEPNLRDAYSLWYALNLETWRRALSAARTPDASHVG
jgi:asparagine synthase (glutamine-hydrolysing)